MNATGKTANGVSISMKALAMAGNMIAMWAISKGIELAAKAIDNYVHRLDNAKEALQETQSELDSVTSQIGENKKKIEELSDLKTPSITDKEDLERLKAENKELRIRQRYLEMQEKGNKEKVGKYAKEDFNKYYGSSKYGTTKKTIEDYKGKYGITEETTEETIEDYKTNYVTQPSTGNKLSNNYLTGDPSDSASNQSTTAIPLSEGKSNLTRLIAEYEIFTEKKKEAVKAGDATAIEEYNNKLETLRTSLSDVRAEIQGQADDMKLVGNSPELESALNLLELIDSAIFSKGERFTEFINSQVSEEDKNKLIGLAEAGKLTENELEKSFSNINDYLKKNSLDLEDLTSILGVFKDELEGLGEDSKDTFSTVTGSVKQIAKQLEPQFKELGDGRY